MTLWHGGYPFWRRGYDFEMYLLMMALMSSSLHNFNFPVTFFVIVSSSLALSSGIFAHSKSITGPFFQTCYRYSSSSAIYHAQASLSCAS